MQTENNPWILIRLIMTLLCILLLWSIISFPARMPGWTLAPRRLLLAAGIGIAIVTFTGLILRDLPKISGLITTGKIVSPLPVTIKHRKMGFLFIPS